MKKIIWLLVYLVLLGVFSCVRDPLLGNEETDKNTANNNDLLEAEITMEDFYSGLPSFKPETPDKAMKLFRSFIRNNIFMYLEFKVDTKNPVAVASCIDESGYYTRLLKGFIKKKVRFAIDKGDWLVKDTRGANIVITTEFHIKEVSQYGTWSITHLGSNN